MSGLLQTSASTTSMVNAAVVVLIIVFLTLPTVFVLAEYLRNRRQKGATASASVTVAVPAPPEDPNLIRSVATASVAHDFTREAVPPEIGYVPPGGRIEGPVGFAGHLQFAPSSTVLGDVEVTGSLAIGDGCYAGRNVSATGNVYLGRGARVAGSVTAGGRVFCVALSRVDSVRSAGPVELEEGAQVTAGIEAPDIQHVDRIHDPLVRARQGTRVAVTPMP